ncbi:AAA family ATPase [Streptomyces sp. NPDC020799]|uniref:AAA family ATPase n=1 Tax=Streptomyces sp. NPDC020799 TaxID=3365091 RepID=UPI0037B97CF8
MRTRSTEAERAGPAPPERQALGPPSGVVDLRGGPACAELRCSAGDLVIVSGLPGSGKSTLMRRVVPALDGAGEVVWCVDSQDSRERLERRTPPRLPYGVYRPVARALHYAALRRALRSGASVVVHDCGERGWVRRWSVRAARRRGAGVHLVVLDVGARTALAGQRARGRGVSAHAFRGHRRAMARLLAGAAAGEVPRGVASVVLLSRRTADGLDRISFG